MKGHITKRKGKDLGKRGEVIYKLLTSISSPQISREREKVNTIKLALTIMSMKDILSTDNKYFIKQLELLNFYNMQGKHDVGF